MINSENLWQNTLRVQLVRIGSKRNTRRVCKSRNQLTVRTSVHHRRRKKWEKRLSISVSFLLLHHVFFFQSFFYFSSRKHHRHFLELPLKFTRFHFRYIERLLIFKNFHPTRFFVYYTTNDISQDSKHHHTLLPRFFSSLSSSHWLIMHNS